MRRLACVLLASLPLAACLTPVPDRVGYEVDGNRVRWVGVSPGSLLLNVHRVNVGEADAMTFRALNTDFAVDARHVFYRGRILPDEDPITFRILPDMYAIGSTHVYHWGNTLPGANPATWRRFDGTTFSTDGAHVYASDVLLEEADATTFRARPFAVRWQLHANDSVARDARYFYRGSVRIGTIVDCGRKIGEGPNWEDGNGFHLYWGQEELDYLCANLKLPGEAGR